jgi:hypothetical protein
MVIECQILTTVSVRQPLGSGRRAGGHADRIGAVGGPAGPAGAVSPDALLGEAGDALLSRTALEPAGQAGAMSLTLATGRLAVIHRGLVR